MIGSPFMKNVFIKHGTRINRTMTSIQYQLIRSNRKTITITINTDGTILVKAPNSVSKKRIDEIVKNKSDWITTRLEHQKSRRTFTEEEITYYRKKAKTAFAERLHFYESQIGVHANGLRIKDQKTRWGSCSSKGNINLNWRLILAPQEVMDYVIIHELCHLKEMNHSKAFWDLVEAHCPDYKKQKQWLKENTARLGC